MVEASFGKVVAMATDIQRGHRETGAQSDLVGTNTTGKLLAEAVWKQLEPSGQGRGRGLGFSLWSVS